MLKAIAIIAIVIAVLLVAILGYAATQPNTFVVQRTIDIKAPPEKIYPLMSDFHQWNLWSPWEHKDPAMTRTFSGAASGKGAIYAWDGNRDVGAGRMEIMEALPSSKISIALDFVRPFEGHNVAEFTFTPSGNSTTVTWTMRGSLNIIAKILHLFVNMDRMIGKDFEAGLAKLKTISEK